MTWFLQEPDDELSQPEPATRFAGDQPVTPSESDDKRPARTKEELFRREHDAAVRGFAKAEQAKAEQARKRQAQAGRTGAAPTRSTYLVDLEKQRAARLASDEARRQVRRAEEERLRLETEEKEAEQKRMLAKRTGRGGSDDKKDERATRQAATIIMKVRDKIKERQTAAKKLVDDNASRQKELTHKIYSLKSTLQRERSELRREEGHLDKTAAELKEVERDRREYMTGTQDKKSAESKTEIRSLEKDRRKLEMDVRIEQRDFERTSREYAEQERELEEFKKELIELQRERPRLEREEDQIVKVMRLLDRAQYSRDPLGDLKMLMHELDQIGINSSDLRIPGLTGTL
jgi:hypothetical protein